MSDSDFNWIVNCIRCTSGDVFRRTCACGKRRDVVLPITVLRHLDAILAGAEQAEKVG